MKKIDLGQAIGILANIGVIAGIVFLGVEISQNTRSLEVGAYQELMGRISRVNQLAMEYPEVYTLVRENRDIGLSGLQPDEIALVTASVLMIIRDGDMAYYQFEQGLLTKERLESALGPLNDSVCAAIYREVWAEFRRNFVPAYQKYLDDKLTLCE